MYIVLIFIYRLTVTYLMNNSVFQGVKTALTTLALYNTSLSEGKTQRDAD